MSKPIALAIDFKKFTPSVLTTGEFLLKNVYPSSKAVLFHVIEQFFTPPAYLLPYLNIEKERLEKALNELMALYLKKASELKKLLYWENSGQLLEILLSF